MLLRRLVVARLFLLLRLLPLLLLRILVAGLLLRNISRSGDGLSLGRLLRVIGGRLRTRAGVEAVSATATVLAVAGRRTVIAGGVPSVKEAARHLAHALAKLGQKLQRAFILRLLLLGVTVAGRRLLIALRRRVLLRITTLWLGVALRLGIIALLRLRDG